MDHEKELMHFLTYLKVYQVVGAGVKKLEEVKKELIDSGVPDSTARRYMANITEGEKGFLCMDEEDLWIDDYDMRDALTELYEYFDLGKLYEDDTAELRKQIKDLEEKVDQAMRRIHDKDAETTSLHDQLRKYESKEIGQMLNNKVLILDSISVGAKPKVNEQKLLENMGDYVDSDFWNYQLGEPGKRERHSFFSMESKLARDLTWNNYLAKMIQRILNAKLLNDWNLLSDRIKSHWSTKLYLWLVIAEKKSEEAEATTNFNHINVKNIIGDDKLTDQEKFALYTRFTKRLKAGVVLVNIDKVYEYLELLEP